MFWEPPGWPEKSAKKSLSSSEEGTGRGESVQRERENCELHFNTLAGLGWRNGAAMTEHTVSREGVHTCCSSGAGPFPRGTFRGPRVPATSATQWFSCRSVAITLLPQAKTPNRTKCGFWSWKLVRGCPRLYQLLLYLDKDDLERIGYLGSQCERERRVTDHGADSQQPAVDMVAGTGS